MTTSLTITDFSINLYFLIIHYIFKWAAQTQYLKQEQKYTYNKIDHKFVSTDQDRYQGKEIITVDKRIEELTLFKECLHIKVKTKDGDSGVGISIILEIKSDQKPNIGLGLSYVGFLVSVQCQ